MYIFAYAVSSDKYDISSDALENEKSPSSPSKRYQLEKGKKTSNANFSELRSIDLLSFGFGGLLY
jgi:hypothetical protein